MSETSRVSRRSGTRPGPAPDDSPALSQRWIHRIEVLIQVTTGNWCCVASAATQTSFSGIGVPPRRREAMEG
ncbi:MAG TPA: hypothetical protein VM534_02525 [Thermoanaerobaculia bacterium]|nr:hypothetical protein [Thermoanaerobaculia bacterium]